MLYWFDIKSRIVCLFMRKDFIIFLCFFVLINLGYWLLYSDLTHRDFKEDLAYLYIRKWMLFAVPTLPLLVAFIIKVTLFKDRPYKLSVVLWLIGSYLATAGLMFFYWLSDQVGKAYASPF